MDNMAIHHEGHLGQVRAIRRRWHRWQARGLTLRTCLAPENSPSVLSVTSTSPPAPLRQNQACAPSNLACIADIARLVTALAIAMIEKKG
jgi:hypothetical protein